MLHVTVWYREQWASVLPLQQDEVLRDQELSEKSAVSVSESSHENTLLWTITMKWALEETLTSHMMHSPLVYCQTMHTSTLVLSSILNSLTLLIVQKWRGSVRQEQDLPSPYSDRVHSTVVFQMSVLWQLVLWDTLRQRWQVSDWLSVCYCWVSVGVLSFYQRGVLDYAEKSTCQEEITSWNSMQY